MKPTTALLVILLVPLFTCSFTPVPKRQRQLVGPRSLQFFREKSFEFSVDDSMAHHYEKPTVEISIRLPDRFIDGDLTNEFDTILFISEEVQVNLGIHVHEGRKRTILTLSEAVVQKSELRFSYDNRAKGPEYGSVYAIHLVEVLNEWKQGEAARRKKRD